MAIRKVPRVRIVVGRLWMVPALGVSILFGLRYPATLREGDCLYRHEWCWVWCTHRFIVDHGRFWWVSALSPVEVYWRANHNASRAWTGREREAWALRWRWPWSRGNTLHLLGSAT